MKSILALIFLMPLSAFAHCPFEVESAGETYCLDIEWTKGEKKLNGDYEPLDTLSPFLIPKGEIPKKWVYSQALITTWKKGDHSHTPAVIPDFRIFPYMFMESGHHHGAGYEFFYSADDSLYILRRTAFKQMAGCWQLRWTTTTDDSAESSTKLQDVVEFTNLTADEVDQQKQYCASASESGSAVNGGDHHHH